MTAPELLARLKGVRKSGNGWIAHCPGHDDGCQSLSIGEGDDGRVLVHCHTGTCELNGILAALGLEKADLYPVGLKPSARREVAHYDYHDESGAVLYQVVRFEPKDFRQRRPDGAGGYVWNLQGVRRVLYRLPELAGHRRVVIVEGEKDADRLWSVGIPATTNMGGAGKWRQEYTEQLRAAGVEELVILPDNDEAGRAHAHQVVSSWGIR